MKTHLDENQRFLRAKNKVKRIKIFYIHLAGYIVFVALLLYNLYIIEEGPYKTIIIWLNLTTTVVWTVFICIHAWTVFKGRFLFKKSWEDKKIQEFLEKDEKVETTFWE